nr:YfiR family protein [uncultured Sphingomonas sp.]
MLATLIGISAAASAVEPASDRSVAAMVGGIISYSEWPQTQSPLKVCVAGAADHAEQIGRGQAGTNQRLSVARIDDSAPIISCNVLYLGDLPKPKRDRLLASARARPVLTIIEDDPLCRSGAMFCLLTGQIPPTFRLNLDSVARSQVKIDPRVLRISGSRP